MHVCVVRHKFNRNSGNYNYYSNRFQAPYYRNSNAQYTPQRRWVNEPYDNWNTSHSKSYKSKGANRQRPDSNEPAAKRQAVSSNTPRYAAAESAPPADSLTNKLTERTSTIINNVLSGRGNSDAQKRSVSTDKTPTGNVSSASHASSSGQSKRHERLPSSSDKPRHAGRVSDSADRPKQSTSLTPGHGNTANVAASADRVQANKGPPPPPRSEVLLSPNRTGLDAQASLVRMATAPRSRREQLELERMIHEHAKKSTATIDHVQPSATNTGTNNVSNVLPHAADYDRPTEGTNSSTANNVIVIGDETGNGNAANVQNSTPSSGAVKSLPGNSTGTAKSAKKTCVNKNKPKTARVPKAKVLAAKTAKGKVVRKGQAVRAKQVRKKSLPRNAAGARPSQSQIPSLLNLDLGSLGLPPNLLQGHTGTQHGLFPASASRTTSLIPANEQGPLNTLLQMSLHEELICNKLNQCSSEIAQLQVAVAKLDEELQKRIQLKATVSSFLFSSVFRLSLSIALHHH